MAGYYFEVLETVQDPEVVYQGTAAELMAVKEVEPGKFLVVVYKEISGEDGFVITSFLTRRAEQLKRRNTVWPR